MKTPDFDKEQLRALISDVLDGSVNDAGRASLNALLKASPGARRFYRDHMDLHVRLHLDYTGNRAMEFMKEMRVASMALAAYFVISAAAMSMI